MSQLTKLQQNFARSLYQKAEESTITEAINGNGVSPEARLGIYRNNVFSNLTSSLRNIYPVIEKLVEKEFFSFLSVGYITSRPPSSGNLDAYGETFGEFLRNFPPAEGLPYLTDVAALEWAVHMAYHAENHAPINAAALASVPPEDYENLHFTCAPSLSLISSPYPLLRIWEVNQPTYSGPMEVDLASGGSYCAVYRCADFSIPVLPLTAAQFHFLTHLARGDNLYTAYEAAESQAPDFDLATALRTYAAQGLLAEFSVHGNSID